MQNLLKRLKACPNTALNQLQGPDSSRARQVSDVGRSMLPWFIALLLGVLTAITGSAIGLFSDFLGDTRFGFCYGASSPSK